MTTRPRQHVAHGPVATPERTGVGAGTARFRMGFRAALKALAQRIRLVKKGEEMEEVVGESLTSP